MEYAPIVLFVYNRLLHTKNTIQALKSNHLSSESNLIIFSDSPRSSEHSEKVDNVRNFIKSIDGFKSIKIIERDRNYGLANSIIDGVSQVCGKYGSAIVLEDDIVTSPYFLTYMNDALNIYKDKKEVASIHGYVYPIENLPETFFLRGTDCWGWATWQDRWVSFEANGAKLLKQLKARNLIKRFDFDGAYKYSQMLEDQIKGINNSWAVRWHATAFLNNQYTLYPGKSLVENIGNDGSGTHCETTNIFTSTLFYKAVQNFPEVVTDNVMAYDLFRDYFKKQSNQTSFIKRLTVFIRRRLSHGIKRSS